MTEENTSKEILTESVEENVTPSEEAVVAEFENEAEITKEASEEKEIPEAEEAISEGSPETGAEQESSSCCKCSKGKCAMAITGSIAGVILIILLTLFLTPRVKYLWAMHLVNQGDYQGAHEILTSIKTDYSKAEDELKRFVEVSATQETEIAFSGQKETSKEEYKYDFSKKNYYKKTTIKDGSETYVEFYYDNDGNAIKIVESDSTGVIRTIKNKYDKNGNIIQQTVEQGEQKQVVKITRPGLRYIKKK